MPVPGCVLAMVGSLVSTDGASADLLNAIGESALLCGSGFASMTALGRSAIERPEPTGMVLPGSTFAGSAFGGRSSVSPDPTVTVLLGSIFAGFAGSGFAGSGFAAGSRIGAMPCMVMLSCCRVAGAGVAAGAAASFAARAAPLDAWVLATPPGNAVAR